MKHNRLLLTFCLLQALIPLFAQEENKPELNVTPIARFYYDGALYLEDETELSSGTTMPDARIGLKATYGNFYIKVDVGFAGKKVRPKDIFLDYYINKNIYFRFGHFAVPFGAEPWETTSTMKFITENTNSQLFGTDRILNMMLSHYSDKHIINLNLMGDSNAFSDDIEGRHGYGLGINAKYIPIQTETSLLQFGISNYIRTGNANGYDDEGKRNPAILALSSNMNTKVEKRKPIDFTVENVDYQNNTAVYLQAQHNGMFLHTEGFLTNIKRKDGHPSYQAKGFYAQGGILLFGDKRYGYDSLEKTASKPDKGLELAVRYSYTNMNDKDAGINPGKTNDISFAANYYFNRYVAFRLNYTHQRNDKNCTFLPGENINTIQARLQVVF